MQGKKVESTIAVGITYVIDHVSFSTQKWITGNIAVEGLVADHLPEEPDYRNVAAAILYLFLDIL